MQVQICEEYYIGSRKPCRYKSKVLRRDGKRVCLLHQNSYTYHGTPKNLDPPSDPIDTQLDPPNDIQDSKTQVDKPRVRGPRPKGSLIGQKATPPKGSECVSRISRLSVSVKWDLTNFTYPPYMRNFDFTNCTSYSLNELEKHLKTMYKLGRLDSYLKYFSEFSREVKEGEEAVKKGENYYGKHVTRWARR
jgi:hypothetical protein